MMNKVVQSEKMEELDQFDPIYKEKPKLEARHVNVYYGLFHAIKDVSIRLPPHSVPAFIGASGCGKSTFLRLFNRMNDYIDSFQMSGNIMIDTKDIYLKGVDVESLRKELGMVFQKPNPFTLDSLILFP